MSLGFIVAAALFALPMLLLTFASGIRFEFRLAATKKAADVFPELVPDIQCQLHSRY